VPSGHGRAEPRFRRALEIDEKVLRPEPPDTASSLSNVEHLEEAKGTMKQRSLYTHEPSLSMRGLGPENPITIGNMDNLAWLLED
jgi:hypothetical protein